MNKNRKINKIFYYVIIVNIIFIFLVFLIGLPERKIEEKSAPSNSAYHISLITTTGIFQDNYNTESKELNTEYHLTKVGTTYIVQNRTTKLNFEATIFEGRSNKREIIKNKKVVAKKIGQYNSTNKLSELKLEFDHTRRQSKLWAKEIKCKDFAIQFVIRGSLGKCALASYPGSGNTWIRHLIEEATGIFTGSVYDDGQIYLWGYYGELDDWNAGTTIVQKTHHYGAGEVQSFGGRGILLVRNPYRAIMSYHNYLFAGHNLYAPMVNYRRKDWPSFVHLQARIWLKTFINWLTFGKELIVVHYENLRQDPLKEIRRILKFLKMPMNEERLLCIKTCIHANFKRHPEHFSKNVTIFSNATRDKLDRAIRYAVYLLEKYNHGAPPLHLYEFYNGTSSNKIVLVSCKDEESMIDCDDRVDRMNYETSNSKNQPLRLNLMFSMKTVPSLTIANSSFNSVHVRGQPQLRNYSSEINDIIKNKDLEDSNELSTDECEAKSIANERQLKMHALLSKIAKKT